jgi:hypothetical protein
MLIQGTFVSETAFLFFQEYYNVYFKCVLNLYAHSFYAVDSNGVDLSLLNLIFLSFSGILSRNPFFPFFFVFAVFSRCY